MEKQQLQDRLERLALSCAIAVRVRGWSRLPAASKRKVWQQLDAMSINNLRAHHTLALAGGLPHFGGLKLKGW